MKILVRTLSGTVYTVEFDITRTVGELKKVLAEQYPAIFNKNQDPSSCQHIILIYQAVIMGDLETVESFNYSEDQCIFASIKVPTTTNNSQNLPNNQIKSADLNNNNNSIKREIVYYSGELNYESIRQLLRDEVQISPGLLERIYEKIDKKDPEMGKKVRENPSPLFTILGLRGYQFGWNNDIIM